MANVFLIHSFNQFQQYRYNQKIKLTFVHRIRYSWFQDYLRSCIDPPLKFSQLNYGECPAANSPGNFLKKCLKLWLKRRFLVNLLQYFVKKGINFNLGENSLLLKVKTFFYGNFPANLLSGILRNLTGIFLTVQSSQLRCHW